ncbi:MAG: alkaline phosphatase [Clostridia bacterium]
MMNHSKFLRIIAVFCMLPIMLLGFACDAKHTDDAQVVTEPVPTAVVVIQQHPTPTPSPTWIGSPQLKYVFLFIGDGMGPNQVQGVNEALLAQRLPPLSFTKFPVIGEAITNNVDGEITDSAASATAIATGHKTENGCLGQSAAGKEYVTIAETLRDVGQKIGILTTVSLDHATPAGFYAHESSRSKYQDIIDDLMISEFDYFAGGGFHGAADHTLQAEAASYSIAIGEADADAVPAENKLILIGETLTGDKGLPLAADQVQDRAGQLARNVARGIERLVGDDGFFLMTEGGRIDLACHYHDAGDLYAEMLDFDEAVNRAIEFYEAHPNETLIVVTADHETGALSLSDGDRAQLSLQTLSCDRFDEINVSLFRELNTAFTDALPEILAAFGLPEPTADELAYLRTAYEHTILDDLSAAKVKKQYGVYSPIACAAAKLVSTHAGLIFGSGGHSSINVPVYALGVGQDAFAGTYENTEIHDKLLSLYETYGDQSIAINLG